MDQVTVPGDPNAIIDGNANFTQDAATFFNPGTVVTAPAIFCIPSESLALIWNHDSINNPGTPESTQDPANPASKPDGNGAPTIPGLTATNAVMYEWINTDPDNVNNNIINPDAEVIVWTLGSSTYLPTGGTEIEFDGWCSVNDVGAGVPAPPTAVPSFTWMGISYRYTNTCASFNGYDLLIDSSGALVGYVDLSNVSHFASTAPGWQATTLPVLSD